GHALRPVRGPMRYGERPLPGGVPAVAEPFAQAAGEFDGTVGKGVADVADDGALAHAGNPLSAGAGGARMGVGPGTVQARRVGPRPWCQRDPAVSRADARDVWERRSRDPRATGASDSVPSFHGGLPARSGPRSRAGRW